MDRYKKEALPKLNTNRFAYQKNLGTSEALVYALDRWTEMLEGC